MLFRSLGEPEDLPEAVGVVGVVGVVGGVEVEADGGGELAGHGVDGDGEVEGGEGVLVLAVEVGYGLGAEGVGEGLAGGEAIVELVGDEVELYVELVGADGHSGGGEAAGGDVEGDVPPVILKRGEGEAGLADDLGTHVEGVGSVLPLIPFEFGPWCVCLCHRNFLLGTFRCGPNGPALSM